MKFFETVPDELFSPLASPNRALYADALDVLYTAYRENLKIREDTLYSMLRSRLEQQLADATFEGEDIDEDELRDISGRARFLIRKLCGKGWFEKERGDDFEEYITVPSYSSRLLELFHLLRDDRVDAPRRRDKKDALRSCRPQRRLIRRGDRLILPQKCAVQIEGDQFYLHVVLPIPRSGGVMYFVLA